MESDTDALEQCMQSVDQRDIACVSTKSIDKYFLQNVGHGTVDIG